MARRSWSMQDAKNRFSEVVEAARRRALMCGCAILISDVPDRYRYGVRIAQVGAQSDGRGVVRTAAHNRSFPQRHQHWRNRARHCATDPDFAGALAAWLDRMLTLYGERVVPVDLPTARRWGALSAALGNDGADLMIAATALENGLIVVTRNVSDFEPARVAVLDPFSR